MATISPARKTAFRILLAVERGKAHADDLLRERQVSALLPADRNLATALVLGALRWQLWLDAQIRPLLKRPNAKLDLEVLIALRLGAFQLWFLDRIPAHAAIDESVELTKQSGHRFAAGMVNAVLRAGAARGKLLDERLAEKDAHPAWMVERWIRFYGPDATQAICRHGQSQPRLTLRFGSASIEEELKTAGIELEPAELLTAARTVVSGDVTASIAFREDRARVQDEGSQLIGELAACAFETLVENRKRILDACAAPGGKTLILAERLPEIKIVACESSAKRFADLRKRLASCADRLECRLADAASLEENSTFDFALADVPCSGTGTLGRNPEIRHRLQMEDLQRLTERQGAILRGALHAVRPGGRVIYSTCSLEPEENEQVVAKALTENPNVRQISLAPVVDAMQRKEILLPKGAEQLQKYLIADGALRLLPGGMPTDGFFIALLERTA
jgi:16S rRNA (cytosine967-C5)-methyltransferase